MRNRARNKQKAKKIARELAEETKMRATAVAVYRGIQGRRLPTCASIDDWVRALKTKEL